jgi:hypothetical protein
MRLMSDAVESGAIGRRYPTMGIIFWLAAWVVLIRGWCAQGVPKLVAHRSSPLAKYSSGRRDSNPRPQPWQGWCIVHMKTNQLSILATESAESAEATIVTGLGASSWLIGLTSLD